MDAATHLDHVRRLGARIAEAGRTGDLKAPVPSMPGEDLGSLLLHTAGFCLWVQAAAESRERPAPDFSVLGTDPVAAHEERCAALVEVLEAADPQSPGWSWGSDQHTRFWFRRAAQELAVHCWDAENAAGGGGASAIDPELAADGVDEMLEEFGPTWPIRIGGAERFGGDGETLHLHATDLDGAGHPGEWMITCRPDHFEVEHAHGKGDVAAKAPASDLLLFLWGRVGADRLEVFGESALLDRWQERVRI